MSGRWRSPSVPPPRLIAPTVVLDFSEQAAADPAQMEEELIRETGNVPDEDMRRTFNLGARRTFQFRVDVQNLLNRQHYSNPELNPTSTNFGQVRTVTNDLMRFITFNSTFVNRPKKPFQSPGTHQRATPCPFVMSFPLFSFRPGFGTGERLQDPL